MEHKFSEIKKIICAILTPLLCAGIITVLPTDGEEQIYDKIVRLHVIANSDSDGDQSLKLKVRDAVLGKVDLIVSDCKDKDEAERALEASTREIEEVARAKVAELGYDYEVSAELGTEYYPTRRYEKVTLPAGEYSSFRVKIGSAKGKNWWCVLFPGLCTSNAEPREKMSDAGFSQSEIRILTEDESPKYVIKFRILEIIRGICRKK